MNKKLLLGLGSTLILSVPILAATSCGDDGKARATGSQFLKDNTDSNKIIIRIDGSNLSTNQSDWVIKESNSNSNSNVWTLDTSKSNSSSTVYFSANKNDTKDKKFSFLCNGSEVILDVSTPLAPSGISSKGNAFQGYQGNNQNIEMNDSNKANVSISSTESLAINFEFNKNASNSSQFMKMTLPPQLKDAFEGYQGYDGNTNIKWTLKENNNNSFKIENNTLSSTSAIDPASTQNITLVGTISMGEWTDTFEIKVNFSKQASDIQISSVSTKVQNDKVIVTISGSKLPTESNKWKFKENNTVSSEWTLSTSPAASATQVTFEATYANVIGKTFTIEGTGSEGTTASKQFTVPVSTISAVTPEITNDGNLILNVQGTNLSSTKSLYVFTFVSAAPLIKADDTATNPSIDTNQIQLTWTDASNIKFTINKQGDNGTTLTKGLYGAKFSIGIKDQTAKTEFTFSDYVAPTAIDKEKFFTTVTEGDTEQNASSPLNISNITGSGLSYTITTSSADKKFVRISLPKSDGSTNIFSFLSGQKGFTETGSNTTLTWSIPVDSASEWTYDESTSELKNNTALDASTSKTIAITGTITDKITSRAKTFTLNLTLSLYVAPSITGEPTVAIVNEGEDKGKKIKVTFTGTGLSTTLSDWTISEKTITPPPAQGAKATPSWTIDASSTANNVIFMVDFNKDTMGKTFTFSAQNVTGSKDVTIPTTTLTQVSSSIIDEAGNLILTFEGTNLSANLDIYDFNHKTTTTTFADSVTPPTIDEAFKNKINVEWKSATQIVLTIQKVSGDGSKDALTKGLYGQTYEVNVINSQNKQTFEFDDYVAPTGVTNGIFGNSNYGPDNNNLSKPLDTNAFQGNNSLTWTITVPSSTDKWVQLNLKHNDFLQSLEGQKGFGQTNNESTKLSWAVKDSDSSKFTYSVSDGLKNKEELTDTGLNVIMVGTLTDELTGVTKTFELNLTIKIQSASTTQNVTSATSNITDNGDLTILLTGTNLSQDPTKYQFTYVPEGGSGKDVNVTTPTVNSSMLEVDSTVTPSDTQVQFIIKKIKQGGSSYQLPTAQTKGLYGKTFSVTSVDSSSSNPASKAQQLVTFKFGSYIAPTGLNKQSFFKDVASQSQPINSGGESQPNSFPISNEEISTPDTSKPFEYKISSKYKNFTYIYIDLPQANDILSSIEGQKGFSSSPTSSNPSDPAEEYTQVQWTLKNTKGRADTPQTNNNFELSNNLLYNKNALTEGNSVVAELTATITDQLTSESVTFDVKLTFELGTLEAPTITAPSESNPKENITLNAGNESAQGQNTNIELTVKGSNLPKDISQWTITEATTTLTPGGRAGKTTLIDVNNNVGNWTIKGESTDLANPGIIFTTTWSLVAGKQLNFAVDGFENVKQKFAIPSPSFNTDSAQNKEELNKGNIEFTIKGTDLSTDAGMYTFELEGENSQYTSFDPKQYGITIAKEEITSQRAGEPANVINSAIKVVIPKMIQQTSGDGTRYDVKNSTPSKISDFYGKNIKIQIKNDTTKSVTCPVPGYSKPTQIQKGILGSISAGATNNSLTQIENPSITPETSPATNQSQQGRYELNKAGENLFEFTITLDKWESSYVKIGGIKDYNKPGTNSRESVDFLSYFVGLNGFTDSAHTSLTWAFKDTPQQPGSGQQSLIDQATNTNGWTFNSDGLTNTTPISDENGLSTTLVGTLTDLETNKTVTFDMKVTVKKPINLKPTISTPAPTPTLEENNTKVKVTITGTNLPTDISKWTITEDNSPATPPTPGGTTLAEGGDTSNSNIWSIDSSSTNTSVTFIANYKDVVAKKYKFALTDSSDISTTVTCPAPTYTGANAGFANNHYDIRITITGTNLPGDINMYTFGKVTLTSKETANSQEIDLNNLQKSIDFTSGSEVNIVFNKYNSSNNNALQTKGLYGKTSSFRFSNETEGTSHELTFPSYSLIGMKSAFLGTISTGSAHGNTPDSLSGININDDSNNSYSATITTNSSNAKYIKFELPKLTTQPDTTTFLTDWFTGYEGFTSSAHTSLTWAIDTTDTVNSAKWDLTDNVLTNKSGQEITVDGIPVLLTATIKDTETEEQVVCKIQLTVKLGADVSGSGNGGNAGGNAEGSTFVIGGKN